MKKLLVLVLILSLTLTCFAGCGSSNDATEGLVWSNWVGVEEDTKAIIQGYIDDFNATVDESSQVSQINWPWGDTETQVALRSQGSEQYDIAQLDIKMLPALAEAGILADLSEVFSDSFFDQFPAGSVEVGQFEGVQYGVPWTIAPMAMIANPTILAESGVDFDIVTIADFEKACDMVLNNHPDNLDSDPGNDIIPYAAMTQDSGTAGPDYEVWMRTFGASLFDENGDPDLDSAEAIECMEWFVSLLEKGYIQSAMTRGDARTLFSEGRVAFYDDALSAKASLYNSENGTIEEQALPMSRPVLNVGDDPQAQSWGHVLVIIDRSENKETAASFIEYLLTEEVALDYLEKCGMMPTTYDALATDAVADDYWMSEWTPILEQGALSETAGLKASTYQQIMLDQLQAALNGSKTAEEACIAMQKAFEAA